jgi:murein DD-endopeptidase MepM/ murein hydrolase activator NlpD
MIYYPVDMSLAYISYPYGWREHPDTGEWHFHNAVDFASYGSKKIPIYACQTGTVIDAGYDTGDLGNYIYINHTDDIYYSRYLHLDSLMVATGEEVQAGQQIGIMGTTGLSTGVHLDFQIATVYPATDPLTQTIDPMTYLENALTPPGGDIEPSVKHNRLPIYMLIKYF